uniref:Uncharacterized protein n=1 Tax=Medicago truncatula TaxID=3880 RepID=A2Q4V9_MEDTR|nr:hypothetical protein MtrDRAFT_AC157891g40v2 [Medicago truncatula]
MNFYDKLWLKINYNPLFLFTFQILVDIKCFSIKPSEELDIIFRTIVVKR